MVATVVVTAGAPGVFPAEFPPDTAGSSSHAVRLRIIPAASNPLSILFVDVMFLLLISYDVIIKITFTLYTFPKKNASKNQVIT